MNFHQHAKNEAFSSFCFKDTVDLKFLQSRARFFSNMGFAQEYSK